jgi:hypothetical protein
MIISVHLLVTLPLNFSNQMKHRCGRDPIVHWNRFTDATSVSHIVESVLSC